MSDERKSLTAVQCSSFTHVEIRHPFTCASCGGKFYESHCCPSMPWGNTAPGPIFIPIPNWTANP